MSELTKKTASAWRSLFGSEEGQLGLQWILDQRPPLDEDHWQQAAGFEQFHKRIQEVLEYGAVRADQGEEREDKLKY